MGETSIQWCDFTFNPYRGCTKVSPGCANCYADTMSKRNPGTLGVWGPNGTRVVAAESYWKQPIKWNKEAAKAGERRKVFCASLADVFEDWQGPMLGAQGHRLRLSPNGESFLNAGFRDVTMADVRARLFRLIDATPNLNWLLLTKRPENIERMMPAMPTICGRPFAHRTNVWLGVSVEDQQRADERIPLLLKVPAAVRFLSCEPLLEAVDLSRWLPKGRYFNAVCEKCGHIGSTEFFEERRYHDDADVVCPKCHEIILANEVGKLGLCIVGGESGPKARPFNVKWARSLRDQCRSAGVAYFLKQLGSHVIDANVGWPEGTKMPAIGGRVMLRDSHGGEEAEWPEDLQGCREFPR